MTKQLTGVRSIPTRAAVALISVYQNLVSPGLSARCRFQPSCSAYTADAIRRFGVIRGFWLGAKRLARCHPLHPGGFDPVPESWRAR